MNKRLEENLAGREQNYILPFLWQRGEAEAVIREEVSRVHAAGIRALCVEARPHPDFLGPGWWRDMDVIMEEARKRGMRVWVLDDDHFPTGHAAGRLVGAPRELRRLFLKECHIDARGPQRSASFLVKPWLSSGDEVIGAVAAQRDPAGLGLTGDLRDITSGIRGDLLRWDIPEGFWRIFLLIATATGGFKDEVDYVNPLVQESVKVLIDTVYEPFYARYAADFGGTYAGFFSDEPGFYNDKDGYDYRSALGKKETVLPWSAEMPMRLGSALGSDWLTRLPLLWHDGGERTGAARFAYMDAVSRLYAQNFTQQIGDWCRAHRVEYIGHVLEDNGVHARLGIGAGHFYRSLWGQDMSGIDVVLWQIVPGYDEGPFAIQGAEADGAFYHYGLAKLGSSLAHLDPRKKGRAMCEVFGAYGWREGLRLMKWITDHMLVRGINVFVPHAFSQAAFPDPDCPPHLYARGRNPQYRLYRHLNDYTNRISHLLSGGTHVAAVAVLYHAEAEWSGACMPFERPLRELMRCQIDGDVVSADILLGFSSVAEGRLRIADETYHALVLPWCEALPAALLARLCDLADQGLPLLVVDELPRRASESIDALGCLSRLGRHARVRVVPLGDLASVARESGYAEILADGAQPFLRSYHVRHDGLDVHLFFNEHPYDSIETSVQIPGDRRALSYDAFANAVSLLDCAVVPGGIRFPLRLSSYESLVVLSGPGAGDAPNEGPVQHGARRRVDIVGPWSVSLSTAGDYPAFTAWKALDKLGDMSLPEALPDFSGTFRYETGFMWDGESGDASLDLGEVFETAEAWLNGRHLGVRICPPYRYALGDALAHGDNTFVVEVTNTLGTSQRDYFSRFAHQEPSGLLGSGRDHFPAALTRSARLPADSAIARGRSARTSGRAQSSMFW